MPLDRRPPGSGPRPANERGGAHIELLAVATCVFGVVLCRRLLARLPKDRLPPGPSIVSDAPATLRRIGLPEPLSLVASLRGRMKGEVVFYRLFDVGASVDLEEILNEYCGRLAERIIEDLVPFLHDAYETKVDPEPYTVYCISVSETPVREFTTTWRREVTGLLANDPRPEAISDEEVEDTWRNWFSYYQDDLVVLEWDAALIVEPSATYEDTLTVFELANLQLLELRTYDAFLDKVVDKAYDDLEDLFARSSFLRTGPDTVKELAEVRMDLAEATFQVDNISKLWGDWFLGRVYRACVRKFELDSCL